MVYSKSFQTHLTMSFKALALALLVLIATMPSVGATAGVTENNYAGGSAATKAPATYEECIASYQNFKLSSLQKALGKRSEYQVKKLASLTAKVNASSLTDEQKASLVQSMANDSAVIAAAPAASKDITDVKTLKESYCKVRFYGPLRSQQVKSVLIVSNYYKRDTNFNTRLNQLYNMNYTKLLKDEINNRTNNARDLMNKNLIAEAILANALVSAPVDASNAANVQSPDTTVLKTNFQSAYKAYTESWVLKKAGDGFVKDSNVSLVSVSLLDDKGNEATDHFASVNKATVVLKVNGKQYTKHLERGDVNKAWQNAKG